jgi:hypothetical protein
VIARVVGLPEFVALAMIVRGWAIAEDGDLETGLATLERGYALWKATGFENWQSWYGVLRADLLLALGRAADARAEIEDQKRRIESSGELVVQSLLLSAEARALAAAKRMDEASIEALLWKRSESPNRKGRGHAPCVAGYRSPPGLRVLAGRSTRERSCAVN